MRKLRGIHVPDFTNCRDVPTGAGMTSLVVRAGWRPVPLRKRTGEGVRHSARHAVTGAGESFRYVPSTPFTAAFDVAVGQAGPVTPV